jgi:hypothetical protein
LIDWQILSILMKGLLRKAIDRADVQKTLIVIASVLLAFLAGTQAQTFTQVTNGAIVNDIGMFTGGAWCDFNNDGFLDLFVSNWSNRTNVFYRNNGNGTFTRITQGDPVQEADYHTTAAAADYDNDGYPDLVVAAGVEAPTSRRNLLFHNNGDETFSRVSGGSVTNQLGFFAFPSWADYDADGFVDLFVTDAGVFSGGVLYGAKNLLFHNNGDGTFTKVTSGAIVNDIGIGFGALWTDYDNDGFMDLVVINLLSPGASVGYNFVYHNNRDGTFTRVQTNSVAMDAWPNGAEAAAWGDYDNDGLPDLFVGDEGGTRNRLYHNNGRGSFTNVTSGVILVPPSPNGVADCAWGDYDNDGYLDLFVGSWNGPNGLYHNNGDGTFTRILTEPFLNAANAVMNGVAWVDYDNDGSLDLFLTRYTLSADGVEGPASNLLYHNRGNTNAWVEVKLIGAVSNRSGIGAKVRLRATIGGKTFWQMRELTSGGGWDMHPLVAHFGLGDATNVDTLRIEWPSGIVQTLTNVATKQILTVVEHQLGVNNTPTFTGLSRSSDGTVNLSAAGNTALRYLFEGSTNMVNWAWLGVRSNATGTVQFTDLRATNYLNRFYHVSIP